MGYGKLRKVSISKKNSTSNFQQTASIETISAVIPKETSKPDVSGREIKRRRSSHRRSIYSIEFEIDTVVNKPKAPDGGYGWMIVFAVHLSQMMSIGFLTSLGIFYIEWREYFDSTAAQAGLVVSLSSVVLGVITPLAVGIAQKVGSRPLVMIGGVIVFVGLLATSFASSIVELMFTVGVLTAFGYGLIVGPSILLTADYFDEKFALANGIAFSGISIGQLVTPPIAVEFIYWFGGWRGAILVIGAIMLNLSVCGALMRPLKSKATPQIKTATNTTSFQNYECKGDINNNKYKNGVIPLAGNKHKDTKIGPKTSTLIAFENPKYKPSLEPIGVPETDDSVCVDVLDEGDPITFTLSPKPGTLTNLNKPGSCSSTDYQNSYLMDCMNTTEITALPPCDKIELVAINEQPILNLINCDDQAIPDLESNSKLKNVDENTSMQNVWQKIKEIIKDIASFLAKSYGIPGVFLSPLFIMMIPAIVSLAIGWYATITYQVARAITVGISEEDAAFLLSLMGIGSLIGRVGHGWFIDKGLITNDMLLVICLGTCSATTFLVTFVDFFPVLGILAAYQGMTMGIANTLAVVIIKTVAKPGFEESAVGMLYLIWGFGDVIGGVVAGYIYDITSDYNIAFYFAGSALALSTILVYITSTLKDRIVNKLFAKLEQRQLEKSGSSADQLNEMIANIPGTEEYDNPVFKIEEVDGQRGGDIEVTSGDAGRSCNTNALTQIEIHDSWERASTLPDTYV